MATLNTRIILRNDSSANWLTNEAQVLLKGEVGIEFLSDGTVKMKIGDGTKTWGELAYFGGTDTNIFEATPVDEETHEEAIARVVGDVKLAKGDVAIVTVGISGDAKEYTAYVYNGSKWAAMDGNYNADNVIFDEDFVFTTKVGTVQTLTNGSATVTAAGKSVKEFFAGLFAAEKQPVITNPSYSLSASATTTTTEIGGKITALSWDGSFSAGSYEYGSIENSGTGTGITPTYEVTCSKVDGLGTTLDGTFPLADAAISIDTVGAKNYATFTGTCTYPASSRTPVTNLGNEATAGPIAAGEIEKTASVSVTGIRNAFYGSKVAPITLSSATIRQLSSINATSGTISMGVVDGARQVIIAVPSNRKVTKVADEGAFGTDIFSSFVPQQVSVGGADATADSVGNYPDTYTVYVYSPSAALGANTYTVTLANA